MLPKLNIKLFNYSIRSFHFFGVVGFFTGTLFGIFLCYLLNLSTWIILLMSLIGACTFFLLAILAKIITAKEIIVYYHHEIAILTICSVVLYLMHLPVLQYLDITIIGIAVFLAFGRLGCFSAGCCHGKPFKNGILYSHEHVKAGFTFYYENIPLFPIQLIESLFVFLMVITGTCLLLLQQLQPGTFLILYTVGYGSFRFILEFFRGDAERPYWKGLSEAQWTTLLLITLSVILAYAGYIPFYEWHIFLSVALFLVAFIMVISKDFKTDILRPRHVEQIAQALYELSGNENKPGNTEVRDYMGAIQIYQTRLGLNISKSIFINQKSRTPHYTVSSNNKHKLNKPEVEQLAALIKLLQKHNSQFRVIEKQKDIFQIVFS